MASFEMTTSANNMNKSVTGDSADYLREPEGIQLFKVGIEALMAIFGIAGNICVCLVISRQVKMRTTMNLYIRNLAIADIGLLMVSFPLAVVRQELNTWPLGEFFCRYIYPGSDIFYGVSVWSITVIAFERYRNIDKRNQKSKYSRKSAHLRNAMIWLGAFVVQCVPLYVYMEYDSKTEQCWAKFPNEEGHGLSPATQVYTLIFLAFLYIIPLAIISWTYLKISQRIGQSSAFHMLMYKNHKDSTTSGVTATDSGRSKTRSQVLAGNDSTREEIVLPVTALRRDERRRFKQNNKARRILTPLVVVFAVTMLPFHSVKVLATYWSGLTTVSYYWTLFTVCGFLLMVNSSINPFIYAMVSEDFRKAFKKLFRYRGRA